MTAAIVDNERRKFLRRGTNSLAVVGAAFTAMPFLASWQPSEATRLGGQPIRIDLDAKVTLGRLAMVMPSADRVLVSALERTDSGAHLVLREVRRDGRIGAPVEISAATPERTGGFARLATSGTKVVVAWTDVRPGAPAQVRTAIAEVR